MSYKHFVLTRLNVKIPWVDRLPWDELKLERRVTLFERICLPSMAGQTISNYTWLVFISPSTPARIKERLAAYRSKVAFELVAEESYDLERINAGIRQRCSGAHLVLSTRLDSDDALSRRHIELIQTWARAKTTGRSFCNFNHGFLWQQGRVYAQTCEYSNCFSLLEPVSEMTTGYAYDQRSIKSKYRAEQIEEEPGWLQSVHVDNSYTFAVRHSRQVARRIVLKSFSLEDLEMMDNPLAIALQNCSYWSQRSARKIVRGVLHPTKIQKYVHGKLQSDKYR